jgi:HEPN domain-containing protein
MKSEKEIMQEEWLQYAKDDLESAKVVLEQTDNYHISVYHSHQTIEKILKWFLLKNGHQFPFIHDLKELLKLACEIQKLEYLLEDILFVDNLSPQLRYPTGEKVTKNDAEKSLQIAEKVFREISPEG